MPDVLGFCGECGQPFRHDRDAGRGEGFRVLNSKRRVARIKCEGCGRRVTVRA